MVNLPNVYQEYIQISYLCTMRAIKQIEIKISKLSPGLISELDRYLDFLINKRVTNKPKRLKQDWAEELKDIKISSVELQKKALDWRQK